MSSSTRWRARPVPILFILALALCVGMLLGPLAAGAEANGAPQTLHVSEWTGPTAVKAADMQLTGRETVIKVGTTYHMWYGTSTTMYYTSSTDPDSFPVSTPCTFTDNAGPYECNSMTVLHEGDTFYMIAYGPGETGNKVFDIYTSTDGTAWTDAGLVFDGTGLPGYSKIDGPFLFKDGDKYRLYFQVKTPESSPTRYDIYTAEASGTLADIASTGDTVDFTLANSNNPVLSPDTDTSKWDGAYVMHPWVVKDGVTYYMWYSAHNGTYPQRLGFAYSTNGYDWTKGRGNPILPDPANGYAEPSVIKDGDTWRMWCIARAGGDGIVYYEATGPFEFSSIEDAITRAESGDTILVWPGNYTLSEGYTPITKNLELRGVPSSSGVKPVIQDTKLFSVASEIHFTVGNFKLALTQNGGSLFSHSKGTLEIKNCVIDRVDTTVDHGYNLCVGAGSGGRSAQLIFTNNRVDLAFRNTINSIGNNSVIIGNTFNVGRESVINPYAGRTSVLSLIADDGSGDIAITNNTFIGANRALAVDNAPSFPPSKLTYKHNKFVDTRFAFELSPTRNTTSGTYDISQNYYKFGTEVGPPRVEDADATGGFDTWEKEYDYSKRQVTREPWIASYTDDSSHAGEPGFWPVDIVLRGPVGNPVLTPEGQNVCQSFFTTDGRQVATITFPNVTSAGETTVKFLSTSDAGYQAPVGFKLGDPPVYVDISTTAGFTGKIKVCLNYKTDSFPSTARPQLYHYEINQWVNRTVSDGGNGVVCGEVLSLSPFAVGVETTAPTVTGVSSTNADGAYKAGATINVTVTFSELVYVTGTPKLSLNAGTGAVASYASGSGTSTLTFSYTVAAGHNSTDLDYASASALTLNGGSIKDADGNNATLTLPAPGTPGSLGANKNIVIDTTAPTVTINQAEDQADPTNESPIYFTVVFSEPVTGFSSASVTLSGTAGATTALVGGSGTTYTVAVSGMTKDGTVIATIPKDVAQDAAGNWNVASTSTDNVVTYDTTAPTVTINQAEDQADPTNESPIYFTAVFSEPVTDFTDADVTLGGTAGATKAKVTKVTGSGITASTTYTVAVSGMTKDGTVIATIPKDVAKDAAGNWNVASTSTDNVVTYDYVDRWTDITDEQWIERYGVTADQIARVAQGYDDGTFRPRQPIIRSQFAKMALDGYKLPKVFPETPSFRDVPAGHYYYGWIEGAKAAQLITGYKDQTFKPDRNITRQEVNTILGRYLAQQELDATDYIQGKHATYTSVAAWYAAEGAEVLAPFVDKGKVASVHAPYTAYLVYHEVVLGTKSEDGSRYLLPLTDIIRAQAAVLIVRTSQM